MKFSLAAFGIAISFLSYGAHAADASVNDLLLLAVASTNQTDGPSAGDWPNQAPAKAEVATNTSTSTVDLATIQSDDSTSKRSSLPPQVYNLGNIVARRTDYSVLTDGSDPLYSNAALQATSYLTYTVISNTTTYAVAKAACLAYCDSVKKCVTANMYNEIGNPLLDHVFSEKSNRKCALFGDVPSLAQMTNKGGQQLYGTRSPANYIKNSAVFYASAVAGPATPAGYVASFGPLTTAVSLDAAGFLEYDFLTQSDPATCAGLCTKHASGSCVFFDLWTAMLGDIVATHVCVLYSAKKVAADATMSGIGALSVTASRGYTRKSS